MSLTVVTLIHGTWAADARWTQAGSQLREKLCSAFGDNLEFETFGWSGRNSHAARIQAGKDLKVHLLSTVKKYPSANHFLIAHSHGGNVVLYALGEPELRFRIRGVATLATPFISCEPRNPDIGYIGLAFLAMYGVPIIMFTLSYRFFRTAVPDFGYLFLVAGFAVPALLLLLKVLAEVFGWSPYSSFDEYKIQEATISLIQPPPTGVPMYCARVRGDEAKWALGTVHWWTNLPFQTLWLILALTALGGLILVTNLFTAARAMRLSEYASGRGLELAEWVSIGVAACVAWYVALVVLPRLRLIAFGFEHVSDTLYTRITVVPVPPEVGDLTSKPYSAVSFRERWRLVPKLRHCAIYEHPEVLEDLTQWMRARIRRS